VRVLLVGLGTQGRKRIKFLGQNFIGAVDPNSSEARYSLITDVPVENYDAAFLCVPDGVKLKLIDYCVLHKKHVLVEKPLALAKASDLLELQNNSNSSNIFIYTAYNHRFEPNVSSIRNILNQQEIGRVFSVRMCYGNGTSQLVKSSDWRDKGLGVISDLAPHLLDMLAFWFGAKKITNMTVISHSFETKAPDHAVVHFTMDELVIEIQMSLCMWRNTFECEIIGEKGSLHVSSLCKWGPSTLIQRQRVMPSGKPIETVTQVEMPDPTWELEHAYFFSQIKGKSQTNFLTDCWIADALSEMESRI
jgi:predicted dehydrogenase